VGVDVNVCLNVCVCACSCASCVAETTMKLSCCCVTCVIVATTPTVSRSAISSLLSCQISVLVSSVDVLMILSILHNTSSFQWKMVHFDPLQSWNFEQIAKILVTVDFVVEKYHLLWFFVLISMCYSLHFVINVCVWTTVFTLHW